MNFSKARDKMKELWTAKQFAHICMWSYILGKLTEIERANAIIQDIIPDQQVAQILATAPDEELVALGKEAGTCNAWALRVAHIVDPTQKQAYITTTKGIIALLQSKTVAGPGLTA